jgi:hypothetical protein
VAILAKFFKSPTNLQIPRSSSQTNRNKGLGVAVDNKEETCITVKCFIQFWPSLSVNSKKKNCNPYFIVIMITVLIMNVIFWVVNFKTQNYFVISTTQYVYLRLSMYDSFMSDFWNI